MPPDMQSENPFPILRDAFRAGGLLVQPERNCIIGPDGEVHLEPRVMDVMCAFGAQAGEVLSRESLITGVWGVRYGGDESLTRAVSILRKCLGTGAIETIAKRGYRLTLAVGPAVAAAPPHLGPTEIRTPRANPSYALRLQGRGPNRIFPVASLDFWRLPPLAYAIALALALGLGALDVALWDQAGPVR